MSNIVFSTENKTNHFQFKTPDGKIQTQKQEFKVAVGKCPSCGAILIQQEGMIGETLHRMMLEQNKDGKFLRCPSCGENCCIGAILDVKPTVINVADEKEDSNEQSSGENADTNAK